jgi:hypothetical protein
VSSWKGLQKRADAFIELGAVVVGVAADTPQDLSALRARLGLSFLMLSDPQLITGQELDCPVTTRKSYLASLALHPEIRAYPRRAFLNPAVFIWRGEQLVYEWRQSESVLNLLGARGRPSPQKVLELARDHLG